MSESPQPRAATAHSIQPSTAPAAARAKHSARRGGARRSAATRSPLLAPPLPTPPQAPGASAALLPLAETLRAGHAQLAERLTALERALDAATAHDVDAATPRAVRTVRAEVQRASGLLAALTRLAALPETPLRLGQVEVADLLISALSRWKSRAPEGAFELALPGHEPTLLGDGALIAQAIEGLIAWAAAHAAPGDIRVSLWPAHAPTSDTESDAAAGDVTISVRVPLAAAPADDLPQRLFACVAAPQPDGAGAIELALAQAIAMRHAGRAWAEVSAGEQALTLALTLPAAPDAATLAATAPHSGGDMSAEGDADGTQGELGAAPALLRARSVVVVAHGDARMARYLRANLEAAGYRAHAATTLEAALQVIALEEPDLTLLDLTLPSQNEGGAEVRADGERRNPLARALGRATAPIIALGPGDDPAACVAALDAGACDFIAQPLSVEETLARVRRALRPLHGAQAETRQRVYTCGDLVIDDTQRSVTIAGAPAALSRTEYRLLRALAQNPGKTLSHETLLARVWGPAYSHEIEFVWVYIRRLRRKVEPDPAHPRYILTAPGVGYRLAQVAHE